jgi:hypothetical protein
MKKRRCIVCREPLTPTARIDKTTCGPSCRTRLCRQRQTARNTSATPSGSVAARLGAGRSNEPVASLDALRDAPGFVGQLALWMAADPGPEGVR